MEWKYGPGSRQSPVMISDSPNLHLSASRVLLELDLKELDLNVPLPGIYEFFFGVSNNMLGTVSDAESDGAVEVINIDTSSETSNSLPPVNFKFLSVSKELNGFNIYILKMVL